MALGSAVVLSQYQNSDHDTNVELKTQVTA